MSEASPATVLIHANLHVSPAALQAVVAHARRLAGPPRPGRRPPDTADLVAAMISRFLAARDFEGFVQDPSNYPEADPVGSASGRPCGPPEAR